MASTSVQSDTRFDWYAATIVGQAEPQVIDALTSVLRCESREGKALHGYARGYELHRGGTVICRVLAGGKNGAPHAWASGDETDEFVAAVRDVWPLEHRVTRMDAATDFDALGCWDALFPLCMGLADERSLKVGQAGDWLRGTEGRTLYLGSFKSAVFARLYEKGKQLQQREGRAGDASAFSPDHVRLEVVVRPDGVAREQAAVCEPIDAFGYADWTKELASRVFSADVERVHIRQRRVSDEERAIEWMVAQYGDHLANVASRDDWDGVLRMIRRIRARQLRAWGRDPDWITEDGGPGAARAPRAGAPNPDPVPVA